MIFIAPWDDSFWTTENPTRNLEETYYQQNTFILNGWTKRTQKLTGNIQTKPTVADIQKWRGINPMGLIIFWGPASVPP